MCGWVGWGWPGPQTTPRASLSNGLGLVPHSHGWGAHGAVGGVPEKAQRFPTLGTYLGGCGATALLVSGALKAHYWTGLSWVGLGGVGWGGGNDLKHVLPVSSKFLSPGPSAGALGTLMRHNVQTIGGHCTRPTRGWTHMSP